MKEKIEELVTKATQLRNEDISHLDLGVNGFNDVEIQKNKATEDILKILNLLQDMSDDLREFIVDNYIRRIDTNLSQFLALKKKIDEVLLEEGGIYKPEYPKKRENIIAEATRATQDLENNLNNIETELLVRLQKKVLEKGGIPSTAAIKKAKADIEEIDNLKTQATKALDSIKTTQIQKGLKERTINFEQLQQNHLKREWGWFIAFIVTAILTVGAAVYVFFTLHDILAGGAAATETAKVSVSTEYIIVGIFKRLVALSIPLLFMKICLSKYNLERNLRIIYAHRTTVLSQYALFENAIDPEDKEAKNRFRLEIARYIFTDPQTGYMGGSGDGEVSVSPVINLVEGLFARKEGPK